MAALRDEIEKEKAKYFFLWKEIQPATIKHINILA